MADGSMEEKWPFTQEILLCVRELYPRKWVFRFKAWERREENKGISEKAQSFWEEGLVCACWFDLVKCLFKRDATW